MGAITIKAGSSIAAVAEAANEFSLFVDGMELTGNFEDYKMLYQGAIGTTAATVYTTPAGKTTFVKTIKAVNTNGASDRWFQLYINGLTDLPYAIISKVQVPTNGWADYTTDGWKIFNALGQVMQIGANGLDADMTRLSTDSETLGLGSVTFTYTVASLNLGWLIGTRLRMWHDATNYQEGQITAVSGTQVTVDVDYVVGAGTYATWDIGIAGDVGSPGSVDSINGLTAPAQFLVAVDDTNVTLAINSVTDTHTFTMGWNGVLAVTRGGTGLSTIASGKLLYASALDTLAELTLGTNLSITAGVLNAATGSSATLTDTYVGYGSGANLLTGNANFTYNTGTSVLSVGFGVNDYLVIDAGNGLYQYGDLSGASNGSFVKLDDLGDFTVVLADTNTSTGTYTMLALSGNGGTSVIGGGINDTKIQLLDATQQYLFNKLAGVGTQMVVASPSGILSRQNIPVGTVTNFIFTDGNGFDGTVTLSTSTPTLSLTTSLTTGSVVFIGAGGAITEDNSLFFWNNTSKLLGVGLNSSLAARLHVKGTGATSATYSFIAEDSAGTDRFKVRNDGLVELNTSAAWQVVGQGVNAVAGSNHLGGSIGFGYPSSGLVPSVAGIWAREFVATDSSIRLSFAINRDVGDAMLPDDGYWFHAKNTGSSNYFHVSPGNDSTGNYGQNEITTSRQDFHYVLDGADFANRPAYRYYGVNYVAGNAVLELFPYLQVGQRLGSTSSQDAIGYLMQDRFGVFPSQSVAGGHFSGTSRPDATANPTAVLHIGARNSGSASMASLKIDPTTTLLVTPESGAVENNGTHIYWTSAAGTRYQLDQQAGSGTVTSVATAGLISGGTITTTGTITTSMNTNKLVGRGTAGVGIMEEITLGTGLSLSGTTLNVTGGSGTVTSIATAGLISGGTITTTGTITTLMNTDRLVGRYSASTGVMEEIALGSGLSIAGGTLTFSGGGTSQFFTFSVGFGTDVDYQVDGTADDVQINAAIAALPAEGGKIILREGDYSFTAPVVINADNVAIEGNGTATKITIPNATNIDVFQIDNAGVHIANLKIDGNGTNQTTGGYGIKVSTTASNVRIEQCTIINTYLSNIFVDGADEVILTNNYLDPPVTGCNVEATSCNNIVVTDNNCIGAVDANISVTGTRGGTVSNNVCRDSAGRGIETEIWGGGISGNDVYDCGGAALYAAYPCAIDGNGIYISTNPSEALIILDSSDPIGCTGNEMVIYSTNSAAVTGIEVNATHMTITGNTIQFESSGFAHVGIDINGQSDCNVSGNTIVNYDLLGTGVITGSGYANNITGNNFYGFAITVDFSGAEDTSITANTIQNGSYGISAINASIKRGFTIGNNNIYYMEKTAIHLEGVSKATVSGNKLRFIGILTNNTYDGIILTSTGTAYSTANVVTDNNISTPSGNKHRYGIRENSSNDGGNLISDNIVTDAVTANISTQGATTVAIGNIPTTLIPVSQGGTGLATVTSNTVPYGAGTSALSLTSVNATATNKFLRQVSSGAPSFEQILSTDISGLSIQNVVTGGVGTAYTATYAPAIALTNLLVVAFVAHTQNTITTPTFAPNGLTAHTMTKTGGDALAVGDIQAGGLYIATYIVATTTWEVVGVGDARTNNTLAQFAATTSAQLAGVISDETGTGLLVFDTAPTLSNPVVGTQSPNDNSTKAASTAYVDEATDYVKLTSGTATTQSAVSVTLTAGYYSYEWRIDSLIASVGSTSLYLRIGTAGGIQSGASDYAWIRTGAFVTGTGTSASVSNAGDGDDAQIVINGASVSTTNPIDCVIEINNPAQTAQYHHLIAHLVNRDSAGTPNTFYADIGGTYKATTAVTTLQVLPASGTITFNYSLWGKK